MLSQDLKTCKTKRRSSCSAPREANMSIICAQEAVKYTQETTHSSLSSLEAKQHRLRSSSCEPPYQPFERRPSTVHFINESNLSIVAQDAAKYTQASSEDVETKWRISRSTSLDDGQQRCSREAVHFKGETDLSIVLAQEAVKYAQETSPMSSQGLIRETKRRSSRSTSREAGQRRSSREYTQETTRSSSSSLETKQRSSRSTSRDAGRLPYRHRSSLKQRSPRSTSCEEDQHRSSLKQHSPRSTFREAEAAEIPYQRRGRSGREHFETDESDLSITTQDVAKYRNSQEITRVTSAGPVLETTRRSSRSTSREAGQRRRSREAVHFTGESDLSIMLAQEAVKYSQETAFTKPPPQHILAKIWGSLF